MLPKEKNTDKSSKKYLPTDLVHWQKILLAEDMGNKNYFLSSQSSIQILYWTFSGKMMAAPLGFQFQIFCTDYNSV